MGAAPWGTIGACSRRSRTPSSSGPAPTGWSPPAPWPTRLGRPRARGRRRGRWRREVRAARRGLRARHVQLVLPARRRIPSAGPARARAARAPLGARAGRRGPPAGSRRRARGGAPPRRRADGEGPRRGPPGRRRRLAPAVRALAAHPRPAARRAVLAVPAGEGRSEARGPTRRPRPALDAAHVRPAGAPDGRRAVRRPDGARADHRQRPARRRPGRGRGQRRLRLAARHARPGRRLPRAGGRSRRAVAALASRARASGAQIRTGALVDRVVVGNGRALGVTTADGTAVRARRAVLADVPAPTLLGRLVDPTTCRPGCGTRSSGSSGTCRR